jgi:prephenate dehydrogenase
VADLEAQEGLRGPVLVVGAGLLGTSLGLALRARGVEVFLRDVNSEHLRTATGLGAGIAGSGSHEPQLVVVAVPPDLLSDQIRAALDEFPAAIVTDIGSIKTEPLDGVRSHPGRSRYVGSHPMAGTERSGPLTASSALFDGRPWAITPHEDAHAVAVELVTELAEATGSTPVRLTPEQHDQAVARTSHLPHLMAALVAGRLAEAPEGHLDLSGPGVRDVTRVAGGDPSLWQQIIPANRTAVLALLDEVRERFERLRDAVAAGDRDVLGELLSEGVAGTQAIPGKHGGPMRPTSSIFVAVPDHPGELARLFADAGEAGVNIEDVHIDHDPGREVGLVELVVDVDNVERLVTSLAEQGWTLHQ